MPTQYKFKDWMAMVKAIDHAIDLNIPKGKDQTNLHDYDVPTNLLVFEQL